MSQGRQQNRARGGGKPPQQQQQQGGQLLSEKSAGEVFAEIMRGVDAMAPTIVAALPTDVPFGQFRSTLMMAMRNNPDIMHCSTGSIITGAMKAAIDGVLLDGKEAALVPSSNKVKDFQTGREFYRKDARYNIMVAGLRKSIMKGGKIRDLQSTVVYANERFSYERGLNPTLVHVPILDEEKRGDKVGAYSVAWFVDGGTPSFEVMNRAEIYRVRDMAQSGPVWKGAMEPEMWRKTVVRRHRKALPGQETRVDLEARDDFPMFGGVQLDIAAGNDGILPAKVQAADAPKRGDFAAIEGGGDTGVPLDFGSSGEMTAAEIARENDDDRNSHQVAGGQEEQGQQTKERAIGAVPAGHESWEAWADDVVTRMKIAPTLGKLDAITAEVKPLFDTAPDEIQLLLGDIYEMRATDHREAAK